jgi:hypothetical protein
MQVDGGGVLVAFGPCYTCRTRFRFDPALVPVVRVDGVAQPMCRPCVEYVNPVREARGLLPIIPMPGAYCDG